MKLSPYQIKRIDEILIKKGIKYLDIRIELLDHFCCEAEKYLEKGCDFGEVIEKIFSQKKGMFRMESSFWIGPIYSMPSVVMKQLVNFEKKWIPLFIIPLLVFFINRTISKSV